MMIHEDLSLETNLQSAIKEALERKGVLRDVKARIRASVYNCLEDKTIPLPEKKSRDLYLASELVRDLLTSLNLSSTLSVFCEEMGQPPEIQCDREFVAGELGFSLSTHDVKQGDNSIPLLIHMVQELRLRKENYELDSSLAVHADK